MADLPQKHELFCQELIKHKFNQTKAALEAGYAKKGASVQADRLLKNAKVQNRLSQLLTELSDRFDGQKDEIIRELRELSFSNIKNYVDVEDGGGIRIKTFDEMPKGASKAIKRIKEKRIIRESKDGTESVVVDSTIELDLWSKEKSLELLGKYEGMYTDNVRHSGSVGLDLSKKTDSELDDLEKDLDS